MGWDGVDQSYILGKKTTKEGGREGKEMLQLRPRSSGPIFASRHSHNVGVSGSFLGTQRKGDQQDRINTWSKPSLQGKDVLTNKTGVFGSQAGSFDMKGFSAISRSRTCSTCSTSSTSSCSSFCTNSCSSCTFCTSCSSHEAKGWSSRSSPKEIFKYI